MGTNVSNVGSFELYGKKYNSDNSVTTGSDEIKNIFDKISETTAERTDAVDKLTEEQTQIADTNEQQQEQVQAISDTLSSVQNEYTTTLTAATNMQNQASIASTRASNLEAAAASLPAKVQQGVREDGSPNMVPNPAKAAAEAAAKEARMDATNKQEEANVLLKQAQELNQTCSEIQDALAEIETEQDETEEQDAELEVLTGQIEEFDTEIADLQDQLAQLEQENENANNAEPENTDYPVLDESSRVSVTNDDGTTSYVQNFKTGDGSLETKVDANGNTIQQTIRKPDGTVITMTTDEQGNTVIENNNYKTGMYSKDTVNKDGQYLGNETTTTDKDGNKLYSKSSNYENNQHQTIYWDDNGKTSLITKNEDGSVTYQDRDDHTGIETKIENGNTIYNQYYEDGKEIDIAEVKTTRNQYSAQQAENAENTNETAETTKETEEKTQESPSVTEAATESTASAVSEKVEEIAESVKAEAEATEEEESIKDYDRSDASRDAIVNLDKAEVTNGPADAQGTQLDLDKYYDEFSEEFSENNAEYRTKVSDALTKDIAQYCGIDISDNNENKYAELKQVYETIAQNIEFDAGEVPEGKDADQYFVDMVNDELARRSWDEAGYDNDYVDFNNIPKAQEVKETQETQEAEETQETEEAQEHEVIEIPDPDRDAPIQQLVEPTLDEPVPDSAPEEIEEDEPMPNSVPSHTPEEYEHIKELRENPEKVFTELLQEKIAKAANLMDYAENIENEFIDALYSLPEDKKNEYEDQIIDTLIDFGESTYNRTRPGNFVLDILKNKNDNSSNFVERFVEKAPDEFLEKCFLDEQFVEDLKDLLPYTTEITSSKLEKCGSMNKILESQGLNGTIENSFQGDIGDCWLLSGINALSYSEAGRKILNEAVSPKEDNSGYVINFKGLNKEVEISNKEILDAINTGDYSYGDADMVMWELAFEKAYSNNILAKGMNFVLETADTLTGEEKEHHTSIDGGTLGRAIKAISGKSRVFNMNLAHVFSLDLIEKFLPETAQKIIKEISNLSSPAMTTSTYINNKIINSMLDEIETSDSIAATVSFSGIINRQITDVKGKKITLYGSHAYAIKSVQGDNVTISNPWNSNKEIVITRKELMNNMGQMSYTDLSK